MPELPVDPSLYQMPVSQPQPDVTPQPAPDELDASGHYAPAKPDPRVRRRGLDNRGTSW